MNVLESFIKERCIWFGFFTGVRCESIEIPEGIEEICPDAFYLSKVRHVKFPSTLKKIGDDAFHASDVEKVNFPSSLEEIGDYFLVNNNELYTELVK